MFSYMFEKKFSIGFSNNDVSKKATVAGYSIVVAIAIIGDNSNIRIGELSKLVERVAAKYNNATFSSINDPYLNYFIDPKNGHTKQDFIKSITKTLDEGAYNVVVGLETPPNTFDRSKIIVANKATVEYLVECIYNDIRVEWKASEDYPPMMFSVQLINGKNESIIFNDNNISNQLSLDI